MNIQSTPDQVTLLYHYVHESKHPLLNNLNNEQYQNMHFSLRLFKSVGPRPVT